MNSLNEQSVILTARYDESTGEVGLMVEGVPVIDYPMVAFEGLLIAHDLLEHVNGVERIGTITDELEALGGVWFVRGQHGEMTRDGRGSMYTPMESIRSDVVHMGGIILNNTSINIDFKQQLDYCVEDDGRDLVSEARNEIISEMGDDDSIDHERLTEYLYCAYNLFCQGFDKAAARYKDHEVFANTMFWNIAEAVDTALEHFEMVEGSQLALKYCFESGEVSVLEREFWEVDGYDNLEDWDECINGVIPCERAFTAVFDSFKELLAMGLDVANGAFVGTVTTPQMYYDADEIAAEESFSDHIDAEELPQLCSLEAALQGDFPTAY